MTKMVWPFGCVCHAVRAPGVKWTLLALSRDAPTGVATGSIKTSPVNQSLGPLLVLTLLLVTCIPFFIAMAKTITIDELVAMLERAPKEIETLTAGMSSADLQKRPETDAWSANEVLAHLRACADVRGGAVARILAANHPTLRAVNPLTWIKSTDYLDLEFRPSLRAFARQREELLAILKALPPDGWFRSATVTGAGRPLERTVRFYAEWVAVHERPHLKQIRQIVATLKTESAQ